MSNTVMELFERSEEYRNAYDFANVKPCDNKAKIIYCLRVKFADSIVTGVNVVQWLSDFSLVLLLLLYTSTVCE